MSPDNDEHAMYVAKETAVLRTNHYRIQDCAGPLETILRRSRLLMRSFHQRMCPCQPLLPINDRPLIPSKNLCAGDVRTYRRDALLSR